MVDNQKYLNLLKQETNKFPSQLSLLKREYFRKLESLPNTEEITTIKNYLDSLFLEFNFNMNRILPSKKMNLLVIPLLGKCNLNCKGCDAYAPLCKEEDSFYPPEDVKRDLQILTKKGFSIKEISLEGGEPFLYRDLLDAVSYCREVCKLSTITILTNGTLLTEKTDSFYKTLSNLNCKLVVDKYFEISHLDETLSHIKSLGVVIELDGCVDGSGWFHRAPLDLKTLDFPTDASVKNFVKCEKANNIFTLDRGHIYICGRSASIKHFNRFFNKNLPDCGIDISMLSGDEIAQHLAQPCDLCKYCKPFTLEKMTWKESSLNIGEWADE